MARKKFLRSKWRKYSKLGRGRRKKQKYRKPKGRHNKMREKMKGNPVRLSIGYKKAKKKQSRILKIFNLEDLNKAKESDEIIIAKVGNKKRIEIVKKAKSLGLKFENLNINKFLKKIEKEQEKKRKEEKKAKEKKEEKKPKPEKEKVEDKKPELKEEAKEEKK